MRAPVGAHVVIGRFDLLRSVRLLDLDALSNIYAGGSYFDPKYSEQEGRAEFFRHLVKMDTGTTVTSFCFSQTCTNPEANND